MRYVCRSLGLFDAMYLPLHGYWPSDDTVAAPLGPRTGICCFRLNVSVRMGQLAGGVTPKAGDT